MPSHGLIDDPMHSMHSMMHSQPIAAQWHDQHFAAMNGMQLSMQPVMPWKGMQPMPDYQRSTLEDFSRAASDIACYNDNPSAVFSTLRSVAKKLLKDNARYRTLDTTNPKVMERLIGFEGVLDFLMLLGFESDAMGMKLICAEAPSPKVVHSAIKVLNSYQQRFRMTD